MNYVPSLRDSGKFLACRAENRELPESTLEDGWKLEIYCKRVPSEMENFLAIME